MTVNDCFRYLDAGLPEDIRRLAEAGFIEEAVCLIDRHLQNACLPTALGASLTAHREMLLRRLADFPYTYEEALQHVRERIPDFSEEEFAAFCAAGRIRWTYDRGRKRYFGRFVESLAKTDAGFAKRAQLTLKGAESAQAGTAAESRTDRVIRLIRENGSLAVRIRIRASVCVTEAAFQPGMRVRVHLPIPIACGAQTAVAIESLDPPTGMIAPPDAGQRTVCWEETMNTNHPFSVTYAFTRTAFSLDSLKKGSAEPDTADDPAAFLGEEPPHILFSPYIRSLTAEVTAGESETLEKARRIYDFITENMTYTYMPAYFSLESIAENCARSLTGDCGVFALLFLTMCRAAGIPAAWESGLAAEPDFCGAHDWVRFYAAPFGWLYADPSYGTAAVRCGSESRRQFYFGHVDPYRMAANRAFQVPFTVPKAHWRADPYDNQLGEIETDTRALIYDEYIRTKDVLSAEEL